MGYLCKNNAWGNVQFVSNLLRLMKTFELRGCHPPYFLHVLSAVSLLELEQSS